jgi:putative hydroxymethylpyrimidine transport system substrate-binding protein
MEENNMRKHWRKEQKNNFGLWIVTLGLVILLAACAADSGGEEQGNTAGNGEGNTDAANEGASAENGAAADSDSEENNAEIETGSAEEGTESETEANEDEDSTGDGAVGDGSGADEMYEVDVMLDWYPNAVHSFLYAARENGYFEEENVQVNLRFPANPTDPIQLAATGDITLGITYQPDVIMARVNQDISVKSVAALVRSPLNHIIYMDDSDIQSPRDLEGKRVGYPGIPVNEPLLKTMVEADGGDYDQVELTDVGFELGSSIITGRVDAVIGAYINHEVPVLEHEGHEVHYFNPVDYGVPSFYELVMVTNDDTWQAEEEAIRAFWRGALKGYEYVAANPEQGLDLLFEHQDQQNFPLIREVEEKSLDILLGKMEGEGESFGSQTTESWEETADWLLEGGLIDQEPNVNDMFVDITD